MRSFRVALYTSVLSAILAGVSHPLHAQGTAFTYGGQLSMATNPANGTYDFKFTLFGSDTGGIVVAGPVTNSGVVVSEGRFRSMLDFGAGVFTGAERWLEIAVRAENSGEDYTLLSPRQWVTATPYAITAGNLSGLGAADFARLAGPNYFAGGQTFGGAVSFASGIQAPLRVQGDASPFGEIGLSYNQVIFRAADTSAEHHGTGLLIEAGGGAGPDKNGGNIVLVPGLGTGQGQHGRVVVDGNIKVIGLLAATTLVGDGAGLRNVAASNLVGVLGDAQLAGAYSNAVQLAHPDNQFQGTFTGDGSGLASVNAARVGGLRASDFALLGQTNHFTANQIFSAPALFQGDVEVDGQLTATTLRGDASGLTNVAASSLTGVLGNAQLAGVYSNALQLPNPANHFEGSFTGDGSGLTSVNAERVGGLRASDFALLGQTNYFTASQTFFAPALFQGDLEVRGRLMATTLRGDGVGLTNVAASSLTGVLGNAQLAGTYDNALNLVNPSNTVRGAFTGDGSGLAGVNAARIEGLSAADFARPDQSNYFTRGQAFSGPVLVQDAVRVEGRLEVDGALSAATLTGNGSGLSHLASSNLVGVLGSAQLAGSYSNAIQLRHPANRFEGLFIGDGNGLVNVRAAALNGTVPPSALEGTYDGALNLVNSANFIGGTFAGDASGLVSLNAAALATGTVPDARLSANVALLTGSPAFSGSVTAAGDLLGARLNIGSGHTLTGPFATIAGGQGNLAAGQYSFAAGHRARASHDGAFVWADAAGAEFGSTTSNQFLIRAGGGVGINTNNPAGRALMVNGATGISGTNTLELGADVAGKHPSAGRIGYQTFTSGTLDIVGAGTNVASRRIKLWAESGATVHGGGTHAVLTLTNALDSPSAVALATPFSTWRLGQNKPPDAPNALDSFFIYQQSADATRLLITDTGRVGLGTNAPGFPLHLASGAFCSVGGQWTSVSDRNTKEDFRRIEPREVLAKVADLPITEWRYNAESNKVRHLGPTAQDFHAAFGLGESDRVIGSVDADGVALAAIQGLHQVVREKEAAIRALQAQNREMEERLEALEARFSRIRGAPKEDGH